MGKEKKKSPFSKWREGIDAVKEYANRSQANRASVVSTGVKAVQAGSTNSQVSFLNQALTEGRLSEHKLRDELKKNAVKEMAKGAAKLRKQKKPVTVDNLLEEYRRPDNAGFRALAARVDLSEAWFVQLATEETLRAV